MPSLNPKQALLTGALALGLLLLAGGFRPDGLTWIPGAVYSDSATSHYPAALFLQQSAAAGEFPLWRDWFMAGAPFAANPLNKLAYPLQWAGALFEPLALLNGLVLLHLALAGAGMWRWARGLGISRGGALVSALSFMLAPRLLAGLGAGHLDLFYAAAWWPWLMDAAGRLGAKPTLRHALWTSLFAGLLLLADVRLALYAWPAAGIAFAIPWFHTTHRVRGLAAGLASAGLALVVALGVLAPLVDWSPWLNRGLAVDDAAAFSLTAGSLFGLLLPLSSGFETLTYLGLVTLLLAVVGAWSLARAWRWALLAGLLIVCLWALGPNGPLWPLLAGQGGLLAWFRAPARAWLLVVLIAAPLAGRGMDVVLAAMPVPAESQPKTFRWYRLGAFGLIVASALAGVALMTVPTAGAIGLQVLVSGAGLGVVALLMLSGRIAGRALLAAFVALLLAGAVLGARAWLEWRPLAPWLDEHRPLTDLLKAEGTARVYSPDYSIPQEVAAAAGLRLLGGVDPFQIAGVTDAIRRAGGVAESGYDVVVPPLSEDETGEFFNRNAAPDAALLAEWGVSHIVARYPIVTDGLDAPLAMGEWTVMRNALYTAQPAPSTLPDWPTGWPGLPDSAEVARLNALNQRAWLVSMAALAATGVALLAAWVWTTGKRRT